MQYDLLVVVYIFLIGITPIVVYFSGLYRPRKVAVVMAVCGTIFVVGAAVPHYPEFIKGIMVGYVSAFLLFHLIVLVLRKLSFKITNPQNKHENK